MVYYYNIKNNLNDNQLENLKMRLASVSNDIKIKFNKTENKIKLNFSDDTLIYKIIYILKKYDVNLLVESKIIYENDICKKFIYIDDKILEKKKLISEESAGVYVYCGVIFKLYNSISNLFYKEIKKEFKTTDIYLPTLLEEKTLDKSGYNIEKKQLCNKLEKNKNYLSPAACLPIYKFLKDKNIKEADSYSAFCKVFRKEPIGYKVLQRQREYNVRETIFFDNKANINRIKTRLIDLCIGIIELLGLKGKITTATDMFFDDEFKMKAIYQLSTESKLEIRIYTNNNDTLSVGSINMHDIYFSKKWNIRNTENEYLYSCCLGLGIERWCYVILCQYGLNEKVWPKFLQQLINENYRR